MPTHVAPDVFLYSLEVQHILRDAPFEDQAAMMREARSHILVAGVDELAFYSCELENFCAFADGSVRSHLLAESRSAYQNFRHVHHRHHGSMSQQEQVDQTQERLLPGLLEAQSDDTASAINTVAPDQVARDAETFLNHTQAYSQHETDIANDSVLRYPVVSYPDSYRPSVRQASPPLSSRRAGPLYGYRRRSRSPNPQSHIRNARFRLHSPLAVRESIDPLIEFPAHMRTQQQCSSQTWVRKRDGRRPRN
ncbi:hypothetical protein BJ508DRAFT_336794 [Ascobolus immersus RN42]|uniref:Uncharacterized protein n=1 Tax=Ascobolus immersus RN42 TaxID=1160509 RepID=A0A3N4H7D3_ASCIM|nr:hypothetical protein BJ508DRAFT_336794 [Ascobolus immersus RN42]